MLHFKRNPEAAALAKAEQSRSSTLEAENSALKAQLQKLEGQDAEPASVNSAVLEARITLLQHEVQQPAIPCSWWSSHGKCPSMPQLTMSCADLQVSAAPHAIKSAATAIEDMQ